MVSISQLIAIERGRRERASAAEGKFELHLRNPGRLVGQARRYERIADDGVDLPSESTSVQVRVHEQLGELRSALVSLFDTVATKDRANCDARVNVTLDGQEEPILRDVPVTYLLFLERELSNLRRLVAALPVLDPAENWTWDATSDAWKTDEIVTLKPQKVLRSMIAAPATREHPAQTHIYSEDVPVGRWYTVKFSGALQAERVRQLTDRITALLEAVKRAREEANAGVVSWVQVGDTVFDYLLAE